MWYFIGPTRTFVYYFMHMDVKVQCEHQAGTLVLVMMLIWNYLKTFNLQKLMFDHFDSYKDNIDL